MKIIIVNDEEIKRNSISRLLEQMGHHCQAASSVENVLEIIENDGADMLIIDCKTHKMNKCGVLRIIKNKHPEIKVALLTGLANTASGNNGDIPFFYLNKGSWEDLNVDAN